MRIRTILLSIITSVLLVILLGFSVNAQTRATGTAQEAALNPGGEAYEINLDASGYFWISDLNANEIWQVEPVSGAYTVYQNIEAPSDARSDPSGMVWWANWVQGRFGRLDPDTGEAFLWATPGSDGLYSTQIDKGSGDFWTVAKDQPYLYRFQPGSGQLCRYTLPEQAMVEYLLVRDGAVWLGDWENSALLRLDPGPAAFTTWQLPANSGPRGLDFDAQGRLWFTDIESQALRRFWPDSGLLDTFYLPNADFPEMVAVDGDSVWFTTRDSATVGHLDPAEAAHSTDILTSGMVSTTPVCSQPTLLVTTVKTRTGTLTWVPQSYITLVENDGWTIYQPPQPEQSFPYGIVTDGVYVYFVDSGRQVLGRMGAGGDSGVTIKKLTNGVDTNISSAPYILVGDAVTWTYVVTNIGGLQLTGVTVTDSDTTLVVLCPSSTLAAGETMTCTASGTAVAGAYTNTGYVEATPLGFEDKVQATADSAYYGAEPSITIVKYTNGEDAQEPTGPYIPVGEPVAFTYQISNHETAFTFSEIAVTDESGLTPDCEKTSLNPGESMTCVVQGEAELGQQAYASHVSARVIPPGCEEDIGIVQGSDVSHYFGYFLDLYLVKRTNNQIAEEEPGPELSIGSTVTWTYNVINTSNVPLTDIIVTDDKEGQITCPTDEVAPGSSITCLVTGIVEEGQYQNSAYASGLFGLTGEAISSPVAISHYFGVSGFWIYLPLILR
jgi:uncharacterized repeat protein (TIGR01451 family)